MWWIYGSIHRASQLSVQPSSIFVMQRHVYSWNLFLDDGDHKHISIRLDALRVQPEFSCTAGRKIHGKIDCLGFPRGGHSRLQKAHCTVWFMTFAFCRLLHHCPTLFPSFGVQHECREEAITPNIVLFLRSPGWWRQVWQRFDSFGREVGRSVLEFLRKKKNIFLFALHPLHITHSCLHPTGNASSTWGL